MADELTISEAVQRYEVSRKTVRRRLAEGAIEGARQRPGDHGPEWIFPATSLEALGYPLRDGVEPVGEAGDHGIEHLFEADGQEDDSRRRPVGAWLVLALVLGPILGFLLATLLRGDDEGAAPSSLAAVLDDVTRPGDRIGILGATDTDLPAGRVAVPLEVADLTDSERAVRYIVVDATAPAEALTTLRATARAVLALEQTDDPVWVFDTESGPVLASTTSAAPTTTSPDDTVPPDSTTPDSTAPDSTAPGSTPEATVPTTNPAPPIEGDGDAAPDVDPGQPTPGTTVRGTVTVETGDHFWSIAEDVVAQSLGATPTDAQVATYWAQLIDANADQLVEPGNPDLLLPGQVLQLPAP